MSSRPSPVAPNQSDADSESSDSGVDTLSTSTRGSFPSDFMDLDEFLSVQTQNGQENTASATSCENVPNRPANATSATRTVATSNAKIEEPAIPDLKAAVDVNSVLTSMMLSKMSSLPIKVDPVVFQSLQVSTSQPAETRAENNTIIQWCKTVGVTTQEHQEAMGPSPGKTPVRRRRNSRYVYNPLPITKKADRKFVTQSDKDERYWERRIKNNVAAKRSRDLRRQKEIEVTEKFKTLETENALLKEEVRRLRLKAAALEKKLSHFQGADM
ncbi:hypothetical protein ACROYT_G020241 [Oculina patagonica]